MPRDTDPSPRPLPPTLTEEVLCDFVEGLLPAAEVARVREALAGAPEWARMVGAMESHRRALATLPEDPPPADLLDRVQAVLEREALVGLTEGERRFESAPVSVVLPRRSDGVLARIGPRLWRPLAAAAGIALVAIGAYSVFNPSARPTGRGEPGPIVADAGTDSPPTTIAMADPTEAGLEPERPAPGAADGPAALAAADPAQAELLPAHALALARDGRLLIRVVADRTSVAEEAIEAIASLRGDPVRGVTVERDVPSAVLAAVSAPAPVVVGPASRQRPEMIMAMERHAGGFDPLALVPPGVLSPWLPVELPPALGRTFILELPGTQASLDSTRRALSAKLGRQVRIVLEELSAPAVHPPLDSAALLWWTGPAATWAPRVAVPLVVERER